ncbi:hypothetical protein JTE90_008821 [Oedothorax gibbosus]|uniref:Uncharacterized protein n=1 Tax=Oedothorax gibbosus TaxID=931172 RepID=A0AAV6V7A9_9ARAC|nr:hypothetical protein JTE90_008821 [Oedothorax gibbosus]
MRKLKNDINCDPNSFETLSKSVKRRYIFPAYRISFVWFPLIGALSVLLFGYAASFAFSRWFNIPEVNETHISPVLRKLYFKSKKESKVNGSSICEVEMKESRRFENKGVLHES